MNIINNIENSFYPEIYSQSLPKNNDLSLCLIKKNRLAKYVLAVKEYDSNLDIKIQIANARKSIKQQTSAMWLIKEIGAYVVFVCDELPDLTESQLEIDRTGFHAVIVQGGALDGQARSGGASGTSVWITIKSRAETAPFTSPCGL